jgi:ABC-2 type transport system ATP-binding protein
MVSSHILPELADMCNKVGIIDRGVMGFSGTVDEAIKRVRPRIVLQIEVAGDLPTAANLLRKHVLVAEVAEQPTRLIVTLHEGIAQYAELSSLRVTSGYPIKLFREEEVNLESAFMLLTKGLGVRT